MREHLTDMTRAELQAEGRELDAWLRTFRQTPRTRALVCVAARPRLRLSCQFAAGRWIMAPVQTRRDGLWGVRGASSADHTLTEGRCSARHRGSTESASGLASAAMSSRLIVAPMICA